MIKVSPRAGFVVMAVVGLIACGNPSPAARDPELGESDSPITGATTTANLYVANYGASSISVYAIDLGTGAAALVQTFTHPTVLHPQSLVLDPSGRFAFVANQGTTGISTLAINSTTGTLSAVGSYLPGGIKGSFYGMAWNPANGTLWANGNSQSQLWELAMNNGLLSAPSTTSGPVATTNPIVTAAMPQSVAVSSTGNTVVTSNYNSGGHPSSSLNVCSSGTCRALSLPATTDPWGVAFLPGSETFLVTCSQSATIAAYTCGQAGCALASTAATGANPSAVAVHPNGKWAYVANQATAAARGSVSAFQVSVLGSAPLPIGTVSAGKLPRSVAFDPTGNFLYAGNQGDYTVSIYRVNQGSGALQPIGTVSTDASSTAQGPSCIAAGPIRQTLGTVDPCAQLALTPRPANLHIMTTDFGAVADGVTDDTASFVKLGRALSNTSGQTLVFPKGVYHLGQIQQIPWSTATGSSVYGDQVIKNASNLRVIGCQAVISVNGNYAMQADTSIAPIVDGTLCYFRPLNRGQTPFVFDGCHGVEVAGFEVNGNVQLTTRVPAPITSGCGGQLTALPRENGNLGILTGGGSTNLSIHNMYIHHMSLDCMMLGMEWSIANNLHVTDKNVAISGVNLQSCGRQAVSLIAVSGIQIQGSVFGNTGRTGGAYGWDAPGAGMDFEPGYLLASQYDVVPGNLTVTNTRFAGNLGSQFMSPYANVANVAVNTSQFVSAPDSYVFGVYVYQSQNVSFSGSTFNMGVGTIQFGAGTPDATLTAGTVQSLVDSTILSSGNGLNINSPASVTISGNRFVGTHTAPYRSFFPFLFNGENATFSANQIFVPAAAYGAPAQPSPCDQAQIIAMIGGPVKVSGNQWSTNLPQSGLLYGRQLEVYYNLVSPGSVTHDEFMSGDAIRPGACGYPAPAAPYFYSYAP